MSQNQEKDVPILKLTDAAVEKVKAMMVKSNKEGFGLRIGVITGGCAGFSYDLRFQKEAYENDTVFKQDDIQIFINPESLQYLKGLEIDYSDTLTQSGFQYKNPHAQASCGCGTSFSFFPLQNKTS